MSWDEIIGLFRRVVQDAHSVFCRVLLGVGGHTANTALEFDRITTVVHGHMMKLSTFACI